jgi:hypothetical protein
MVALLVIGWGTSSAQGQLATRPLGHLVSIDNRFPPPTNGYRLIRVTVETNPNKPVTREEKFTVVAMALSYQQEGQFVTAPLTIEVGKSSGTAELYFPAGTMNAGINSQQLFIERGAGNGKYEIRRDLFSTNLDLSSSILYDNKPQTLLVSSGIPQDNGIRWVGSDGDFVLADETPKSSQAAIPALENLAVCFDESNGTRPSNIPTLAAIDASPMIHAVHPLDLPARWIGLSGVQQIYISLADLKTLSLADDARRDSLERWVAAGGTLVVFDAKTQFQDANKIVPFLLGPARATEIRLAKPVVDQPSWREPTSKLHNIRRLISTSSNQQRYGSNQEDRLELTETGITQQNAWLSVDVLDLPDAKSRFVIQSYVDGRIVAVADNMRTWQPTDFIRLQNSISVDDGWLSMRMGPLNPQTFLFGYKIPGVGEPPLIAFRVLIGMFLFAAGPLMVFVLRRWRQLQLLFLLVPLLSLTACGGLLGYAVFVDGFEAWGRVQSVTKIDQRLGSAVAHARCAYYSGRQPGPYRFDLNTVVMNPKTRYSPISVLRLVQDIPGRTTQAVSGGNIRPRTPHQIVSVRSVQTDRRLEFLRPREHSFPSAENIENPTPPNLGSFRNLLGAKILYLAANTQFGLVEVQGLEAEEIKAAVPTNATTAQTHLRELAFVHSPIQEMHQRRYYYGYDAENSSMGDEFKIVQALRNNLANSHFEQPNTYVAIVERNPLIDPQIEPVNYKKQLHVIIGRW